MEERRYSSWMLERIDIGDTVRLRVGVSTIGRHSSSVIRIKGSAYVSRHHAEIEVTADDRKVCIKDLGSINGIFVNDQRYVRKNIEIKNNDLIGIGLTTNMNEIPEDEAHIPVFKLKFAPLRPVRQVNVNRPAAAPIEILTPTPPPSPVEENNTVESNKDDEGSKNHRDDSNDEKPCCSKNIKKETEIFNEEIFEISDDDDFDVVVKPQVSSQNSQPIEKQRDNNTSNQVAVKEEIKDILQTCLELKNDLNFDSNKDSDELHLINSSQRHRTNSTDSKSIDTKKEKKNDEKESITQVSESLPNKEVIIHEPIISSVKKEVIRTVSADIQNIFGDIESDIEIQKKIKEINPLVYNEMHSSKLIPSLTDEDAILKDGDLIDLSAGEELEVVDLGILIPIDADNKDKELPVDNTKSPNIFDSSLDTSKEETKESEVPQNQAILTTTDNIDLDEYTKYVPNSDDEDIEDLMFSQVLINDMKAEIHNDFEDQTNFPMSKLNAPEATTPGSIVIKQEPQAELFASVPKELENSCWIISDDEDFDEELETKVNDWSNKIFSQSFNQMNMSQVYDLHEPDNQADDDNGDDGNLSDNDDLDLLEDDIDYIADLYNNTEKELKNDLTISTKIEEQTKLVSNRKKSPTKELPKNTDVLVDSPVVRQRRLSKTSPIIESASSSEDEMQAENEKLLKITKEPELVKTIAKLPPPVIDAPSLPKHKGKLRGVSAEIHEKTSSTKTSTLQKKICSIKDKIQQNQYSKDLKRKWLEKPSVAKKHDKERKKLIKEHRKDKLKELAEREKNLSKEPIKRKMSTDGHEHKAKVAKVKVTTKNRGAFLVNDEPTPPPSMPAHKSDYQFKIPKVNKKPEKPKRSQSIDGFETFSEQISKPDALLLKRQTSDAKKCDKTSKQPPPPIRRHSINESVKQQSTDLQAKASLEPANPICNKTMAVRAKRTTNKMTFASMERHINENEEMKRKLSILNSNNSTPLTPTNNIQVPSIMKNTILKLDIKSTKTKTVRFNDTPVIHYIERVCGASKKIINKDIMPMTTYRDRRLLIRSTYPIIDNTNDIITNILHWSNEWLIKCNAAAEAASEVIYPMPTQFNSFDHYKSIIFPLMKLEFISLLEREYHGTQNLKKFKVSLEYSDLNQDRIILVTKLNLQNKEQMESSQFDLVILETDKGGPQIFAYVATNRKGAGSLSTIVYEIAAKNFTVEYFKAIKELFVRPVMDKVRVHFGAFNSVYQLQATPLFQKILNPLELLKCKPPAKKKVTYKGFDTLNDKQRQVLLNTYTKIIDETTPNITLIQGPPGTGKSCVITNLILQTMYGDEVRYLDKKILFCAQSNAAVDVITAKLYDISMRMRPEKRFRLIRHGMLNKIHPFVLPVALQKVVEHDQLKKLQAKNKDLQIDNKENLKNQIMQFEAQIAEMSARNVKGTVEEDLLLEKQRQLQLMRNILNQSMRPEDERSLFTWYLSNANIVCATLSSCVNLMQYINFFDICIIDEATQCTEPWTLLPLKFGINSLVLVGDTQQLPATVLSKKANGLGLGKSLFTRIQNCLSDIACTRTNNDSNTVLTTPNSIICSLQTQYRMHPEICRWPNQYFYRNELINAKETTDLNKSPLVPFSILSLAYTQNNACSNGKITNNLEAEFVAKLLKALDGFIPNKYNSYGVITPYAQQRNTLEASIRSLGLTNIMVNTIDSYQGLEKDVIVISNARTHGIGFLSNPQRLNVALTRAKKCLIVCGNFKNLGTVPAWRCLMDNARERKLYHEITVNCIADIQTNVIEKIKLKNNKPPSIPQPMKVTQN